MNLEGRRVAITRLCEPVCRYPTSGPKPASHQRGSLGRSGANWSFPGVETDTSEQVLKFAPKEKAPNRVAQLDDAGQAIVAQIRTAADLAKEDCDRAMSLAHKLSMELRAAEDRTQQMAREVEHWQDRAARAEQWLRTIQQEIEEKLLTRRSFSGAEEAAIR